MSVILTTLSKAMCLSLRLLRRFTAILVVRTYKKLMVLLNMLLWPSRRFPVISERGLIITQLSFMSSFRTLLISLSLLNLACWISLLLLQARPKVRLLLTHLTRPLLHLLRARLLTPLLHLLPTRRAFVEPRPFTLLM